MEARKARQGGRNTDTVCKTKKGPPKLLGGPFQKDKSLCDRGIPLHDAAVQERLRIGNIGVNHAEPCLALGGPPSLSAQTNTWKNR